MLLLITVLMGHDTVAMDRPLYIEGTLPYILKIV
jgi:hypothetical protein